MRIESLAFALGLAALAACANSEKRAIDTEAKASADINLQLASSDLDAARAAGAPTLAPGAWGQARAFLRDAGEQFKKGDYVESRRLALAAASEARTARANAEQAKAKERELKSPPKKPVAKKKAAKPQ
jgi:hypothetical protein